MGSGVRLLNDKNYVPYIDEVSDSVSYVGYAIPGSLETDSVWKIMRINLVGTVSKVQYADGNMNFDNKWSDRASLTYK